MRPEPDLFIGILPFFYAAEERSFRKAAQRLGVTPAAVSKAVLKLEGQVGVKLFVRTSRTVALTPEGAQFFERCREAISLLSAGRQALSVSNQAPRGEVRLSLPFILGSLVASQLPLLVSRYPELSFSLSMTDRFVNLIEDGIDVAIRIGALDDSSLVTRSLGTARWVTVASPEFVARYGRPTHPGELGERDGIVFVLSDGRIREPAFTDPDTGAGYSVLPRVRLRVDQGQSMLAAALSGLGICQILDFMARDLIREGRLIEVLENYRAEGPMIQALTTPERAKTPNVRALFEFLLELFSLHDHDIRALHGDD